jgi:hypothetical protein
LYIKLVDEYSENEGKMSSVLYWERKEEGERNRYALLFQFECKKWGSMIVIGNWEMGRGGED